MGDLSDWAIVVLTGVLVGATIYYAKKTRDIAESTRASVEAARRSAEASRAMIAEARRQNALSEIPVLSITAKVVAPPSQMQLSITNVSEAIPLAAVVSAETRSILADEYPSFSLKPTPIDPLAPHQERALPLKSGPGLLRRSHRNPVAELLVTVAYENALGVPFIHRSSLVLEGTLVRLPGQSGVDWTWHLRGHQLLFNRDDPYAGPPEDSAAPRLGEERVVVADDET